MSSIFDNIKKLRDVTGVGIVECKNALLSSDNDFDKAVIFLRKKGILNVASKSNRIANEGLVAVTVSSDKKIGVMLEVNCETDFVSRSDDFVSYVKKLTDFFISYEFDIKDFYLYDKEIILSDDLNNLKIDLVSKLKENIVIKRVRRIVVKDGFLFKYLHFGKLGVILNISEDESNIALDVLMQIASMNPKYVNIDDIPIDILSNEKQICYDKFKNQYPGKSEILLNKMVDGQINKFFKDNVLLEQDFIKDSKKSIKYFLGNKIKLISFVRFELGEV